MEDVGAYIRESVVAHKEAVSSLATLEPAIAGAVQIISDCLRAGGTVLFCGNGGSAADAQHLAAELIGRFAYDRDSLSAHALTVNTSVLTAVSNDYGYKDVFARQVRGLGRPGDVLVGLSTSGDSENVALANAAARDIEMTSIALVGGAGGAVADSADLVIAVGSTSTPRVQEAHILIGHIICGLVEENLCPRP